MRKVSKKKAVRNRELDKVKASMSHIVWCESCGSPSKPLSFSHTCSVKQYPELEADQENIIIECFGDSDSCHNIWENGSNEDRRKLKTYNRKVEYMYKVGDIKGLIRIGIE